MKFTEYKDNVSHNISLLIHDITPFAQTIESNFDFVIIDTASCHAGSTLRKVLTTVGIKMTLGHFICTVGVATIILDNFTPKNNNLNEKK